MTEYHLGLIMILRGNTSRGASTLLYMQIMFFAQV